ncbi:MAG: ribonuclease R [SAR324 cluster bacterium]|nr:ribonuclease R [SAR324 cluster bacterium]
MKLKKKVILQVLEHSGVSLSLQQIRHRMGLKKQQHAKLKALLNHLILKGKLSREQNKFAISTKKSSHLQKSANVRKRHFREKEIAASGTIGNFSRTHRGYGFVNTGDGRDVFISEKNQHGAMDGDLVEVALFRSQRLGSTKGEIIRIVEREPKYFIARLVRGKQLTLAMPISEMSGLKPLIILPENDLEEAKSGTLVSGMVIEPPFKSKELYGELLKVMPVQTVDELAFDLILTENGIAADFSEDALKEAEQFSQQVRFRADSGRTDLRSLDFVTIDGSDARDFDDAVFVQKNESGTYQLFVSIADVAHYVRPENAIDREAYARGTSTYFPTHAIPMLPEVLSNHLCSLRPKVNRLTLTCEMEIDEKGELLNYSIYESMIRSRARLNYDDVADFMEGRMNPIQNKKVLAALETMAQLFPILSKKRYKRGSINFSFAETKADLNENREVIGFHKEYQSVSMQLIEQFMLEANETVARHCHEHKLPSLYRVHEKPDMNKLEKLQNTFWFFGVGVKTSQLRDPRKINSVLDAIKDHPNRDQIQVLFLKSMALACYRTTNQGHFGLAAEHYTHFTSPIRRYPDLIVHRALKSKLEADRIGKGFRKVAIEPEVAEHLSRLERRAELAERQSIDLIKVIFMESYLGQNLQAQVISTSPAGVSIELTDLCVECFLPLEVFNNDYYHYDDVRLILTGRHSNHVIQTGTLLKVQVLRTDRINRKIEFQLEDWLEDKVA